MAKELISRAPRPERRDATLPRGRRDAVRARRAAGPEPGGRAAAPGPGAVVDVPPRAARTSPTAADFYGRRGQPDLAGAGGGDRRPRRRRVRRCSRPAWPRSRPCCALPPGRRASCCPPTATTWPARWPTRSWRRWASRCARCPRRDRGPPACSTARRWCCWRPRPTPASTSATSPRSPRGRARRGRAARRRQHHRHPARPAPAGAGRRPRAGQRHQGARRARRRGARARQHPRPGAGRAAARGRAPAAGRCRGPMEAWLAPPRAGHARPAAGPAGRQRRGAGRGAARAPGRRRRPLAGPARRPGARRRPRQMRRWNGVLRFTLPSERRGGPVPRRGAAGRVGHQLRRPAHHAPTAGQRWGDAVAPGLLRLSAGCEDADDLVADVLAALDTAMLRPRPADRAGGRYHTCVTRPALWSDLRREVVA